MKSLSAGSGQTLVLIISLAFNLGFCLALGVHRVGRDSKPPCDDRRGERGDMEERLARELGLSDAQRAAVRESKQRMFPDGEDGPRGMRAEHERFVELLTTDPPDPQRLAEHVASSSAGRQQRLLALAQHLSEVRGLLNVEQRERFDELLRDRFFMRGPRGPRDGEPWRKGHSKRRDRDGRAADAPEAETP